MILVNKQKLDADAFDNDSHPLHKYAFEVKTGIKYLKTRFGDELTFVRVGYPKTTEGLTAKGREVSGVVLPTPPMMIPLKTLYEHPDRGTETWVCCMDEPTILPGNLWDIGKKRSLIVEERISVSLKTQADLAYYLYYISRSVRGGHMKVDDPKGEIRAKANLKRDALNRETAIWNMLTDEDQLRKICSAYGIADAMKKEPDALRFELEDLLNVNDEKQQRDPSIRGTKEFLLDLKVDDGVRLRAFIQNAIDNKLIVYKKDGTYRIGDRTIITVPVKENVKHFDVLCNFMASPNNGNELKRLLIDVVTKDYLEEVKDDKDFRWIAKAMQVEGYYNKPAEKVKEMVYAAFTV